MVDKDWAMRVIPKMEWGLEPPRKDVDDEVFKPSFWPVAPNACTDARNFNRAKLKLFLFDAKYEPFYVKKKNGGINEKEKLATREQTRCEFLSMMEGKQFSKGGSSNASYDSKMALQRIDLEEKFSNNLLMEATLLKPFRESNHAYKELMDRYNQFELKQVSNRSQSMSGINVTSKSGGSSIGGRQKKLGNTSIFDGGSTLDTNIQDQSFCNTVSIDTLDSNNNSSTYIPALNLTFLPKTTTALETTLLLETPSTISNNNQSSKSVSQQLTNRSVSRSPDRSVDRSQHSNHLPAVSDSENAREKVQAARNITIVVVKIKLWLVIIKTIKALNKIHKILLKSRTDMMKQGNKWKLSKLIQRHYRNYKKLMEGTMKSKNIWLNAARLFKDEAKAICSKRAEACTLIIAFCRMLTSGFKNQVFKFLRSIRKMQSYIRQHLRRTHYRRLQIMSLLELFATVLLPAVQLVASGKGLDLPAVTLTTDLAPLMKANPLSSPHISIRKVATAEFHSYLRTNMQLTKNFLRNYTLLNGRVMPLDKRKHVVNGGIFSMRRKMVFKIEQAKNVLTMPAFTMADADELISTGRDKLSDNIAAFLQCRELDHVEKQNRLRDLKEKKKIKIKSNEIFSNCLSSLLPEDMFDMIFKIYDPSYSYSVYRFSSSKFSRKLKKVDKVEGSDRRAHTAQIGTSGSGRGGSQGSTTERTDGLGDLDHNIAQDELTANTQTSSGHGNPAGTPEGFSRHHQKDSIGAEAGARAGAEAGSRSGHWGASAADSSTLQPAISKPLKPTAPSHE